MKIRRTVESDLCVVMNIYEYARQFMAEHGNPNQWGPNKWPPEYLIRKDIAEGKSYVCVNDDEEVIGTFFYDYGFDVEDTYAKIDGGSWMGDSHYGVVHRIAGNGSEKGIGAFCINWAYEQCKQLRMDTHDDNIVMQNLLTKLGFERRGIIYVHEDNDPRIAYERL